MMKLISILLMGLSLAACCPEPGLEIREYNRPYYYGPPCLTADDYPDDIYAFGPDYPFYYPYPYYYDGFYQYRLCRY